MNSELLHTVQGGPALIAWFDGSMPSFHDAEILELALERDKSRCRLKVHAFRMTPDANEKGFYITVRHVVITFQFENVVELELTDFNHQNAVDGLTLARQPNGNFLLTMDPCYGLFGKIEAGNLEISFEPGIPSGSVYTQCSA